MAHTWVLYFFDMGYFPHIKPINSDYLHLAQFYCLMLWDCYVFHKVPYIPHRVWYRGMTWDSPIPIPHVDSLVSMGLLRIL